MLVILEHIEKCETKPPADPGIINEIGATISVDGKRSFGNITTLALGREIRYETSDGGYY
ncbi:MAG: hypothetical protein DF168_00120 [Candidatus Moanabacter tarae]|uniref:Uncharacterized protein n=1 Tax=Candidatus Moanibacter tarae TaxID=2200854 RepID=A0A2Z4ADH0_9BACT|nr:MAG: hypothetical protein DF168_00120 [Candidatus Moanabacter tarae]|tara:strand:+ start:49378 stop:49557 length:180 start_codon:yes stop_codon:yes gene_type:complete